MADNKTIVLAKRPIGEPTLDCFRLENRAIPEPAAGEFLIENIIFSMDAGVRGFLDEADTYEGYMPPVPIDDPVFGMTLGKVIKSNNPEFNQGDYVRGMAHWEEYTVISDSLGLERVHPDPDTPLKYYMGALGPVGLTAWVGMCTIGKVQAGETVLVSAAAGATGSIAGQIAKLKGARVIGLTSTAAKISRLEELGYDGTINYRETKDLEAAIQKLCPEGVNVYFDNVGAQTLEAVLPTMAERGRVVCCGMIADYNDSSNAYGVKTLWQTVLKRLTIQGYMVFDHFDVIPTAQAELNAWVANGDIKVHDAEYQGVAQIPQAFVDLMTGQTMGKTLVIA